MRERRNDCRNGWGLDIGVRLHGEQRSVQWTCGPGCDGLGARCGWRWRAPGVGCSGKTSKGAVPWRCGALGIPKVVCLRHLSCLRRSVQRLLCTSITVGSRQMTLGPWAWHEYPTARRRAQGVASAGPPSHSIVHRTHRAPRGGQQRLPIGCRGRLSVLQPGTNQPARNHVSGLLR